MSKKALLIAVAAGALLIGVSQMSEETQGYDYNRLTLARTMYGEARGEKDRTVAYQGVAQVVLNRLKAANVFRQRYGKNHRWGHSVAAVCLAPWQFSCWNANDPNRAKIASLLPGANAAFNEAWEIAGQAIAGIMPNPYGYDDVYHYKVQGVYASWATGHIPVASIGNHEFFRGIA